MENAAEHTEVETLRAQLAKATSELEEYKQLAQLLRDEMELLKRGLLGPKRERFISGAEQLTLGVLATALDGDAAEVARPKTQVPAHQRAKPTGRKIPDESLPHVRFEVVPEEVQRAGLDAYERIGEEVSRVKERRIGGVVVVETVRPKFVPKARAEDAPVKVAVAPPVDLPLERVSAGPGLLAETVMLRMQFHQPLNRQEEWFARDGVELSRSTICEWHIRLAKLCDPLVNAMWGDALQQALLMTDATGVLVQASKECRKAHFWVVVSPRRHVLFRFTHRHRSEDVDGFLKDYRGYLVADAHTVYDHLFTSGQGEEVAIECGCWSHARRYFFKALQADPERAMQGLLLIRPLFELEREFKAMAPAQRLAARREHSKDAVKSFYDWLSAEGASVRPETPLAKAFGYATNQRAALERFLDDGSIPIHNNESERQLRRLAVGRKNWLFVGADDGGHAIATFVSLLASCQLQQLEPWAYLRDLFILLPAWPHARVLELSPFHWAETSQRPDVALRLASNPYRRVTLGLPPV